MYSALIYLALSRRVESFRVRSSRFPSRSEGKIIVSYSIGSILRVTEI